MFGVVSCSREYITARRNSNQKMKSGSLRVGITPVAPLIGRGTHHPHCYMRTEVDNSASGVVRAALLCLRG